MIEDPQNNLSPSGGQQPSPSEGDDAWECGDEALQAQATLRLIRDKKIKDQRAMRRIEGLIYSAGKRYVRDELVFDQVPF